MDRLSEEIEVRDPAEWNRWREKMVKAIRMKKFYINSKKQRAESDS